MQCGLFDVEETLFVQLLRTFTCNSGVRTPGKSSKGAIHCLERGIVPVLIGGFLMINGELGVLMCGFTFSSFAPLATRLCHLHFALEAFSKANVCGVFGLSVGASSACASMGSHVVNSSNCLDWVGSKTMI